MLHTNLPKDLYPYHMRHAYRLDYNKKQS